MKTRPLSPSVCRCVRGAVRFSILAKDARDGKVSERMFVSAIECRRSADVGTRPNITGHIQESGDTLDEEGCFYLLYRSGGWVGGGSGGIRKVVGFDASRSSTVYGRSSEVQVASVRTLPCIKS